MAGAEEDGDKYGPYTSYIHDYVTIIVTVVFFCHKTDDDYVNTFTLSNYLLMCYLKTLRIRIHLTFVTLKLFLLVLLLLCPTPLLYFDTLMITL